MLTKRQNLLETIHGGKPDRYVNQYEAFAMLFNNPHRIHDPHKSMAGRHTWRIPDS